MPHPSQPPESPRSDGGHASTLSACGVGRPSAWTWLVWLACRVGTGIGAVSRAPIWHELQQVLWKATAVLAVLAVIGMLAVRLILWPRTSVAREWAQREAFSALYATVDIDSLETYWGGWRPAFRARHIDTHDAVDRRTFAIQDIQARLSWRSLLRVRVAFAALHATQADLPVRRDTQGVLSIAGMQLNADTGSDSTFLD